jgi:hypothetical protein
MAWQRIVRFIIGWLSLALIDWLIYALVRGLAAIIYLDVPCIDWQWYVPLIVLLISLPLHLLFVLRNCGSRLATGCSGPSDVVAGVVDRCERSAGVEIASPRYCCGSQ